MAISTSIPRLAEYYKRNGLGATIRRAGLAVQRALFSNSVILLYFDLADEAPRPLDPQSLVKVEQKGSCSELSQEDLQAMISFWHPKLAYQNINERFGRGALLWLIKSTEGLAGYGWTLQGGTIEPHYFPLAQHDVHLFDFHVFPQYRGRAMNPFLVSHILLSLRTKGAARAFIEAAEWNLPQLSSLEKTSFHRFGRARKWTIFAHTLICWSDNKTLQKDRTGSHQGLSMAAPSENGRSST